MSGLIIKESEHLIKDIRDWDKTKGSELSEELDSGYGHALRSLGARVEANCDASPDDQKAYLRRQARMLILKYGDDIKQVMKPELLEALNIGNK